jgi:hypothetical protein
LHSLRERQNINCRQPHARLPQLERPALLNDLMRMYSAALPFQKEEDAILYRKRSDDFERYIGPKAPIDAAGEIHISGILNDPEVRYHIFFYRLYLSEKQRQKKDLANKLLAVADEIDKELKK